MSLNVKDRPARESEPAWEIARLFPHQGHWSSFDYLDLARQTNNLVELADGRIEVLSQDHAKDLEIKRTEYAEAAIPEYWIVDPQEQRITVLTLDASGGFNTHGEFTPGQKATSRLLVGFDVDVSAVFAAGRGEG